MIVRFTSIVLIFFALFSSMYGQLHDTREVILHSEDTVIRLRIFIKNPEVRFIRKTAYHWFHNDKLLSSEGSWAGKLVHGATEAFYPNDQLYWQGEFDYGLKIGQWSYWYSDGTLKETIRWKHGRKHGQYKKYNIQGELVELGRYRNGQQHGVIKFFIDGSVVRKLRYRKGKEVVGKEQKKKKPKKESREQKKKSKTVEQERKDPTKK